MNSKSRIISTDEDPSLRIESSAIINLRGVSTKLNKYIVFTMQTYKKLIIESIKCQSADMGPSEQSIDDLKRIQQIIETETAKSRMDSTGASLSPDNAIKR